MTPPAARGGRTPLVYSPVMPHRPLSPARRALYATLTLVGFLVLAETTTRLLWSGPEIEGRMPADPRLRWVLPADGEMHLGGVSNRINSRGYRGPEFATERDPCTLRIYSAGDSSAYGHGVADGEAFVERLPALLAGGGLDDLTVEGINGAVPGFSTYQSLARLETEGWDLHPDLLVISNLWSDGGPARIPDSEFYDAEPDPRELLPGARPEGLLDRSRFLSWIREGLVGTRPVFEEGTPTGDLRRVSTIRYRSNLERMVADARTHGATPILLVLPAADDADRLAAAPRGDEGTDYRDLMRGVAADTGTLLVDPGPAFLSSGGSLFLDAVHPSAAGHDLIVRELAAAILADPDLVARARARCAAATKEGG